MDAGQDHYDQKVEVSFAGLQGSAPAAVPPARLAAVWRFCRGLAAFLAALRKVLLDLTAVALPIVVVVLFISMLAERTIIIEAPTVPKALQERGITPELLTRLVQAKVQEIRDVARSDKLSETANPEQAPLIIETAGLNLSLNSLAYKLKRSLGMKSTRRLKLGLLCPTLPCGEGALTMQVIALTDDFVASESLSFDLEALGSGVDLAAHHLLKNFDPNLLATYFVRQEKYDEAREIAKAMILQGHEQEIWARNLLGVIEIKKKDLAAARGYFDQALKIDARFAPALVNLGIIEEQQDHLDRGIHYFRRAIAIDRQNAAALVNLGKALLKRCEWEAAGKAFEQAVEADPGHLPALEELAKVKERHEKDKVAAQALRKLAPGSGQTHAKSGATLAQVAESAERCSDKAATAGDAAPPSGN